LLAGGGIEAPARGKRAAGHRTGEDGLLTRTRVLLAAAGVAALLAGAGLTRAIAGPPDTRTISLRNIHTDETLTVEYMRRGQHVAEAMKQINWIMRDWRKDETTRIDPELIDLLWEVHSELGSKAPINIISAFRSRATNDMLRKTVGGQAAESRHILGQAADVQFPDIPLKQLRYSALIRERGGVGYYPTSGTPFVHIDTDRVRSWPRLPRHELALLFRNGTTKHLPTDGEPITPEDVKKARQGHAELAQEMAEYHALRQRPRDTTLVASAGTPRPQPAARAPQASSSVAMLAPPPPKLVSEPRPAERPSASDRRELAALASMAAMPQLVSGPTPAVRPRPVATTAMPPGATAAEPTLQLASLGGDSAQPGAAPAAEPRIDGRFDWGSAWLQAPAYDEEHPDEDSYRPFPITPFLTDNASPDNRSFTGGATESLDQVAGLLWDRQFDGEAAALAAVRTVATAR
jgi:uncharacterized protein YcbK (DUF882 family)